MPLISHTARASEFPTSLEPHVHEPDDKSHADYSRTLPSILKQKEKKKGEALDFHESEICRGAQIICFPSPSGSKSKHVAVRRLQPSSRQRVS